jgi:hypothetical protein
MANRFPGGGNMPQQLLEMLNNGEDIGALWEGVLAELAVRGGIGGEQEDAAQAREGEVDDIPNRIPGAIEDEMGESDEEEQEDEEDEEPDQEETEVRFFDFVQLAKMAHAILILASATFFLSKSIRTVLQFRWGRDTSQYK